MRLLLDTHILLWWLGDEQRLGVEVREVIGNPENFIFVSAATVWEMSIKKSLGKLSVPNDLLDQLKENNFEVLNITAVHGLKVEDLPHHHKDPFDRMLIAQALVEGLTVISGDAKFKLYDVPLLSV